jgi:hypothetical protein
MIKITAKQKKEAYREEFGEDKRVTVRLNAFLYSRIALVAQDDISGAIRELLELGLEKKTGFEVRPTPQQLLAELTADMLTTMRAYNDGGVGALSTLVPRVTGKPGEVQQ